MHSRSIVAQKRSAVLQCPSCLCLSNLSGQHGQVMSLVLLGLCSHGSGLALKLCYRNASHDCIALCRRLEPKISSRSKYACFSDPFHNFGSASRSTAGGVRAQHESEESSIFSGRPYLAEAGLRLCKPSFLISGLQHQRHAPGVHHSFRLE